MSRNVLTGPRFWNDSLPKAIRSELNGINQEIPTIEDYLSSATVDLKRLGEVMAELIEDYRCDLQGRAVVKGVRRVGDSRYAVVETLDIEQLKSKARKIKKSADVARLIVEIASCYSPDYGAVDHPCHRWCPRWGSCPTLQRPAIHSVVLHLCQSYANSVAVEARCA